MAILHWSRGYHALIMWLITHVSRDWSCTDHVAILHWSRGYHALITWLIMQWSRSYHVLVTHIPFDNFHPFPLPSTPAPGNYHSLLCLYKFGFLDSTYKWDHTIFVFPWLISLCIMSPWFLHVVTNGRILEITFLWQFWKLRLLTI